MSSIFWVISEAFNKNFDIGAETSEPTLHDIIYKYYIHGGLDPQLALECTSDLINEFVCRCVGSH